ncbi:reticulon-4-interacting protein [Ilyonectria destructans]|nr:reticulon-4-interacting protein [Ilyonectria destructans]
MSRLGPHSLRLRFISSSTYSPPLKLAVTIQHHTTPTKMAAQNAPEMRLYKLTGPGPIAKTLKLTTVPRPSETLDKHQLLIQVVVAGINPADYKIPELGIASKTMVSFPKTPGMDFAGRVVTVGPEVPSIKPGDTVMGRLDPMKSTGSLAEYVVASCDGVAALPPTVSLDQAGAAATAALSAYQTIVPFVKAGDKVFINGGSGGTGTFGIQVAKAVGCHVTVSCSTAKAALCRDLGADETIDYKAVNVTAVLREKGRVFALAVDNVGNLPADLFPAADDFLLPEGRFKFVGGAFSLSLAGNLARSTLLPGFLGGSKHKFEAFRTKNSHEDLAHIAAWMGEGKVRTVIDSTFGFEDVLGAYEKLKKGSSAGKILVRVSEEKA